MTVGGYLLWWDMSKKEKLILIVGIAVILICAVFVLFMLDRSSVIRIFPRPAPKQEKVIELDNLGSADTPIGKTAVVTIFCNDKLTKWDFTTDNDKQTRKNDFCSLKIAIDWLSEQGKKYNKDCEFVIPNDEDSDLYYETAFKNIVGNAIQAFDKEEEWKYIESNIDSESLKKKYNCDNIIYLLFTNNYDAELKNDDEIIINSYVVNVYDKANAYPYELACLSKFADTDRIAPSIIAHEILHLFGAPDLYCFDAIGLNYGTTPEFVEYCRENNNKDIMLSTLDSETGVALPNRITQEITDITAYYIGWLETAPDCIDEYLLVHSQHEYKNRKEINLQ